MEKKNQKTALRARRGSAKTRGGHNRKDWCKIRRRVKSQGKLTIIINLTYTTYGKNPKTLSLKKHRNQCLPHITRRDPAAQPKEVMSIKPETKGRRRRAVRRRGRARSNWMESVNQSNIMKEISIPFLGGGVAGICLSVVRFVFCVTAYLWLLSGRVSCLCTPPSCLLFSYHIVMIQLPWSLNT